MMSSIFIIFLLLNTAICSQISIDTRHLPSEYRSVYSKLENIKQINSNVANRESSLSKIAWIIR